MIAITYIVAISLAILRIAGIKGQSFQAVAHLFMGALLYAWLADGSQRAAWLTVALSVVEVIMFVIQHRGSSEQTQRVA